MQCFSLSELFTQDQPNESIGIDDTIRSIYDFSGGQIIIDRFAKASCAFLRIKAGQSLQLISQQSYCFQQSVTGGFLGTSTTEKHQLWLVDLPRKRLINPDKTIRSEEPMTLSGWSWDEQNGFSFEISNFEDTVIEAVIWQFDEDFPEDEIISLLPIEAQGYFLWGSHGCIS